MQDLPIVGNGKHNRMHYLRDPGEDSRQAKASFKAYVAGQIEAGKGFVANGDGERALSAFANAAHAVQDSYSPAHNEGGNPKEYDPGCGLIDAARNGHSPVDSAGDEGTDDLDQKTRARMVSQTREIFEEIFGGEKTLITGSRIPR